MYHWAVDFQVHRVLPGFPEPGRVAMETQFSSSYYCRSVNYDGLLVYTYAGRGCFRKGDKVWELTEGMAYIISGEAEDISYYYPENETQPWTFMWLVFKGENAASMMRELIARYGHIYRIRPDHPALERLRNCQHYGRSLVVLPQHQAVEMVYGLIGALSEAFDLHAASASDAKFIDRVQQFIIDHIQDGIMPGATAAAFNCSREHLSRLFRAETGITPLEFILHRRLLLTAHLLKETQMSIKEIAVRTGYEKSTNLIRAFKSLYGMTPGEFRRSGALPVL